jgi:hypothetical protein
MGKMTLVNTKSQILMNFLHPGTHRSMLSCSIKANILCCRALKVVKIFNLFANFSKNNNKKWVKWHQKRQAVCPVWHQKGGYQTQEISLQE